MEETHYYPYGLSFDTYKAPGNKTNDVKYNSQFLEQNEYVDVNGDTYGLEWYDFAARSYDPQTGRWMQPDPMMQHASPYMAMGDNPASFTDPLGLSDDDILLGANNRELVRTPTDGPERYFRGEDNGDGTYTSLGEISNPFWSGNGKIQRGGPGPVTPWEKRNWSGYNDPMNGTSHKSFNANAAYSAGSITTKAQSGGAMAAALGFACTASLADGPLPFGEAVGLVAIAGTAAYVYGPALVDKMQKEIDGIKQRVAGGPPGFQYALTAKTSGHYPNVRGGTTYLNKGEVWKYGETTSPNRYSRSTLNTMGLQMVPQFFGNQMEIKVQEKIMIYGYFFGNGSLPPGNSIFR